VKMKPAECDVCGRECRDLDNGRRVYAISCRRCDAEVCDRCVEEHGDQEHSYPVCVTCAHEDDRDVPDCEPDSDATVCDGWGDGRAQ
jgi:hypothetical protein